MYARVDNRFYIVKDRPFLRLSHLGCRIGYVDLAQVGSRKVITGIGGLPGSGKSYLALERIYEGLSRGKVVYTNMRNIYIDKVAWSIHRAKGIAKWRVKERFQIIDTWEIENIWSRKIENAEIVLDEVMVEWLSRDWSKMDRRVILWFSQHRKFRVNFTYIAQSLSKVDGTLRDMTQEFILMKNTAFWRIGFLSFLKLPQLFLAIHFSDGMKDVIQREWIVPLKKYYGFYDSWAVFPSKKLSEMEKAAEISTEGEDPDFPTPSGGGMAGAVSPENLPLLDAIPTDMIKRMALAGRLYPLPRGVRAVDSAL